MVRTKRNAVNSQLNYLNANNGLAFSVRKKDRLYNQATWIRLIISHGFTLPNKKDAFIAKQTKGQTSKILYMYVLKKQFI